MADGFSPRMQNNAANFDAGQRALLEAIALDAPLIQVLAQIVRLIEDQAQDMLCSIVLIDAQGRTGPVVAPNMPAAFTRAIEGLQIGPTVGSCGTAAFTGKPVIVEDIATDPLWDDFRQLASAHGLRACWSTPIFAPDGTVTGTFAMYYGDVRKPAACELEWIDAAAHLASIAIQSDRSKQMAVEKRSMAEAMRIGEHLRSVILDSVDAAIFYLRVLETGGYQFVWVNPAFTRLFGWTESEMAGRMVSDRSIEANLAVALGRLGAVVHTGERQRWEELIPASRKHIEVTAVPVFDSAGRCANIVVTVHDLTARISAERERAQLQAQLHHAQRMQALGTLAGGIAHDFNNILAAIGGNTNLLLEDLPAASALRTHALEIQKGSHRAVDLVRQILAFSRSATPTFEVVDPRVVTTEAIALLRAMLPPKIHIETRFAEDVPHVRADSTQLHQIIMNLVTNAAYALQNGGTVEVILDGVTTDGPSVASITLPAGSYLQLRVIDHGCGMDAATKKRAFDPFFTTRTPGEGTGLGLSVVHGIVESHGGTVDIDSAVGIGTTVRIYIPATDAPVAVNEIRPPECGHGERVMYVDDEEALVFLMERALSRVGYRITPHGSPEQALADFRQHANDFDVVVTDLAMPGMSGAELAAELRKVRADIPIIMTSGYIRREDIEMAERLQINQLVYKSNTIDRLCEALTREITAVRNAAKQAHRPA